VEEGGQRYAEKKRRGYQAHRKNVRTLSRELSLVTSRRSHCIAFATRDHHCYLSHLRDVTSRINIRSLVQNGDSRSLGSCWQACEENNKSTWL